MLRFVRVLALACVAAILVNAECMALCSARMCSPQPQPQQTSHCHHHGGKTTNTPPCPHQQAFTKSPSYSLPISYAIAFAFEPAGNVPGMMETPRLAAQHHPPPVTSPDPSSLSVLRV